VKTEVFKFVKIFYNQKAKRTYITYSVTPDKLEKGDYSVLEALLENVTSECMKILPCELGAYEY